MAHLNVEDLRDEDMRRALVEARSTVAQTKQRSQHETDAARRNLLRWLETEHEERTASR